MPTIFNAGIEDVLIGNSLAMRETRQLVGRLGPSGLSVLIEGPTGVGKELVAQALHHASGREGRLIAINVCAIPDAMFESLLFGHVRGAFTGAVGEHVGHLTEAHRGTLFLDEIGELPLQLQAKLLRALETRAFRKVGGRHDEASDFRLVVATNADLQAAISGGRFRADLAFRFGAAVIRIAPLRERTEDIPPLAAHFARVLGSRECRISDGALSVLLRYEWPGNVRELRHIVELSIALTEEKVIGADAILSALEHRIMPHLPEANDFNGHSVLSQERQGLLECLERHGWHIHSVASELRVTKKTVYARIQRFGITIPGRYQRRIPPELRSVELRAI